MSIAPPSDIVLDVARAADPQRLQAATAKLNAMAAASGGEAADFGTLLSGGARKATVASAAAAPAPPGPPALPGGRAGPLPGLSPYQKFEAVLLRTFVEEMLPKDQELFGDAASADAYRGMMADQLAVQLARSGRIGIARMIERAHGPSSAASPARAAPAGAVEDA